MIACAETGLCWHCKPRAQADGDGALQRHVALGSSTDYLPGVISATGCIITPCSPSPSLIISFASSFLESSIVLTERDEGPEDGDDEWGG